MSVAKNRIQNTKYKILSDDTKINDKNGINTSEFQIFLSSK